MRRIYFSQVDFQRFTIARPARIGHSRFAFALTLIIALLIPVLSPLNSAVAEDLAALRNRGKLIWGADQEGGAPFIFPDPANPNKRVGFEVEIAQMIAEHLGLTAEFRQGQWDKLPSMLDRHDIDVILNGYEWSAIRSQQYGTSVPYYVYELVLIARNTDTDLSHWDDLNAKRQDQKITVSVLTGSAADEYGKTFSDTVTLKGYDGVTDALRAVELGLDGVRANIQDLPIWTAYAHRYPKLHQVGGGEAPGFYVAMTRKEDTELLREVNAAIIAGLRNGKLRTIFERYNLWNATQMLRSLETDSTGSFTGNLVSENPDVITPDESNSLTSSRKALLLASVWTILLSVCSMPLAIIAGLGLALFRIYGSKPLSVLSRLYVELVRGTPLALQLILIYFVAPEFLAWLFPGAQLSLGSFSSAVLALAINYSACEAEIYRAGLQNIPRGQMEAALSLGMTRSMAIRRILIPQATQQVIPPVTNDFIALFKDTAVCSVIGVVELSKAYYIEAQNSNAIIQLGAITALIYLAMSYPLSVLSGRLEDRLSGKSSR
jgi:polar amino acid transport system substrate-binding protein